MIVFLTISMKRIESGLNASCNLMAVACRPLTIDEVSEALTVDFEGENINHKRRMRDPSEILEICSSLIELAGYVFN